MRFPPFLRMLPSWKTLSPICSVSSSCCPIPVSRKHLSLRDYIRKTRLQHTKNKQCNLALVATDIGTYLSVCSAILQNKVPLLQVWLTAFPAEKNKSNQCCATWWDANLQFHFPVSLPFFAVTPWDSQELTTGWREISRTKSKWRRN